MSPLVEQIAIGTEEVLDAVEAVIITDINDCLAVVYERRTTPDQKRAELRGEPYLPLEYEEVPPSHVWIGNFPSLVLEEVGPEAYPYIAVTVEDYSPDVEDARLDQLNSYRVPFTVHCLAKAAPVDTDSTIRDQPHTVDPGASDVFRRCVRMSEAVFIALGSNPETARLISGFSNPVRGQHSLPWNYQHKGRGPNFWFQAVGTSYAIKTYTSLIR